MSSGTSEANAGDTADHIGNYLLFGVKDELKALDAEGCIEITVGRDSRTVNYDFSKVRPLTYDRMQGEFGASVPVGSLLLIRVKLAAHNEKETCVIYEGGTVVTYVYPESHRAPKSESACAGFQGSLSLFLPENGVVFGYIEPRLPN